MDDVKTPSSALAERFTQALVLWGALALVGLFIYLGWVCYIADSEIWSVTLAANIGEEWQHFWVATRPVFYSVLGLAEWPTQSAVSTLMAARSVFILNGLLIIYLTFRLARSVSKNKIIPWLSVLLLVGNSGFLNQGFRIRSDLFASSLALWLLCGLFEEPRSRFLWLRWLALPLATPKAVFHMLCFAPFWRELFPRWLPRKLKDPHWRLRFVCAVLAVSLAAGAELVFAVRGNWDYFLRTFTPGTGTPPLFSAVGFMYVTRIMTKNPLFVASLLLSLITLDLRPDPKRFQFAKYLFLVSLWIFFTPEKISFFIAALLPPFCVFASLWVEETEKWAPALISLLVVVTWISALSEFEKNVEKNSSEREFLSARIIERFLEEYPGAKYYDVIGIVPKQAKLRIFAGPNQPGFNKITAKMVGDARPELILYVAKSEFLEPLLGEILSKNYFNLGYGIFVRAYSLEEPIALDKADAVTKIKASIESVSKDLRPKRLDEIILDVHSDSGYNKAIVERLDHLDQWRKENRGKHFIVARVSPFEMPSPVLFGSFAQLFHFDTEF